MTPAQKARSQGFLASLRWRGVPLFLDPDGPEFGALVEPFAPDQGEYALAREEANAARIHILRRDLTAAGVTVSKGGVFRDADRTKTFRVTAIEDNPASIAVIFTAELAEAE